MNECSDPNRKSLRWMDWVKVFVPLASFQLGSLKIYYDVILSIETVIMYSKIYYIYIKIASSWKLQFLSGFLNRDGLWMVLFIDSCWYNGRIANGDIFLSGEHLFFRLEVGL